MTALAKAGLDYSFTICDSADPVTPGIIIYTEPGLYALGHYLAGAGEQGWMNPWSNYPMIAPAQSNFTRQLPGPVSHKLYPSVQP